MMQNKKPTNVYYAWTVHSKISKVFTHEGKNEYNENNRNLTNFMDIGETIWVVKFLKDQINLNIMHISKDGHSAVVMHTIIIEIFAIVTIWTIVLNEVVAVDVAQYADLGLRQTKAMKWTAKLLWAWHRENWSRKSYVYGAEDLYCV